MSASSRIEQYLKDYPDGDLLIAVGYATAPGMAWLARRTVGRRVSLLNEDTRSRWWEKMSEPDRAACLEFIRGGDVEIRSWYWTKRSRSGGVVDAPQGLGRAQQLVAGVGAGRIWEPHSQRARQQR